MTLHVFDVRDVFVEVFRQQYETDMLRPEAITNPICLALGFREEFAVIMTPFTQLIGVPRRKVSAQSKKCRKKPRDMQC